jgi:hypothetical protein
VSSAQRARPARNLTRHRTEAERVNLSPTSSDRFGMTHAAPSSDHPACAATLSAIARAFRRPDDAPAAEPSIEPPAFALRAEVIAVEGAPAPGARGNCLVEARILDVARGDILPGAVVTLQIPVFTPDANLPSCGFSIASDRLVRGARFEAEFHRGFVGYTMVNSSFRAVEGADRQAIGISTRLGPSRLVAALIAAATSFGLSVRAAGTPSAPARA